MCLGVCLRNVVSLLKKQPACSWQPQSGGPLIIICNKTMDHNGLVNLEHVYNILVT